MLKMVDAQDGLAIVDAQDGLAGVMAAERGRLVRLCAHLSGDAEAAEDLAQETLLEAWRHAHVLYDVYDAQGQARWLTAIARNVCLRWRQHRGREVSRLALQTRDGDGADSSVDEWAADPADLEVDLERDELATLLDRALALLPAQTRDVLIERYIQESPQAAIAARLGLSEGAVKVRLHRGRLALRRVLATRLRQDAATYGLCDADAAEWQETPIWCPQCGEQRLLGCFEQPAGAFFALRCPRCCAEPDVYVSHAAQMPGVFAGISGYKPALNRLERWAHGYYRGALAAGAGSCTQCGGAVPLQLSLPDDVPSLPRLRIVRGGRGVYVCCPACRQGSLCWIPLDHLALCLPEGQRFWREHRRIRTLPEREIEAQGRPALVTSFRSVTSAAQLDVISARDTYEVLQIHGALPLCSHE